MATPVQTALAALAEAIAAQPAPPALPVSANGASIDSIGAYLFDASGNFMTLVAGNRGNDSPAQQISYNGTTDPLTGAVTEVVYFGGKFYQQNSAPPPNNWWSGKPGAWVAVPGDPRVAPPVVTPPIVIPPSGPIPPPIAAASGYTKLVFSYVPTNTNDVQIGGSNRIGAGQTWVSPTSSPVGDQTTGGSVSVANGALTLVNGILIQSVDFDGQNGFSLPRGGYYVRARIAFPAGDSGDGAFWTLSRQHLMDWASGTNAETGWPGAPPNYNVDTEKDILENFFAANKANTYQATDHTWYGIWPNSGNASNSTPAQDGTDGNTPFENNVISTVGFDLTQFQTYGNLYKPSVNGSRGSDLFTFNDKATPDLVTWTGPFPAYTGIVPGITNGVFAPWTFAIQDERDMFLIIGGPGANGGETLVKLVEVWAAP